MGRRVATEVAAALSIVLLLLTTADCGPDTGGSDEAIVHATETGECYHRASCRSLSKSDIPMTRAEAEAERLRPCKVCKPRGKPLGNRTTKATKVRFASNGTEDSDGADKVQEVRQASLGRGDSLPSLRLSAAC